MTELRFEERQLKPYAEYVPLSDLHEGSIYFFVNYVDEEGLFPTLEPFVYVGRDLESGDVGRVYFQDASSFLRGVRIRDDDELSKDVSADAGVVIYTGSAEDSHVLHYEEAIDVLLRCALRRRERQE